VKKGEESEGREGDLPMPYATASGTGCITTTTVHAIATTNPEIDQNQD
jgi:hypothetical protein